MRTFIAALGFALVVLSSTGCGLLGGGGSPTETPQPPGGFPPVIETPTEAPATPTLPPSPTVVEISNTEVVTDTVTLTPAVTEVTATPLPSGLPPLPGSFDVYLGAPAGDGTQFLRWMSTSTTQKVSEIAIKTRDGRAIRAGEYVYWVDADNQPMRANTAGSVEVLEFARPAGGAAKYQLLPSATGGFLAWLSVALDGVAYSIYVASSDGNSVSQAATGQLDPGTDIELIRLTNDGGRLFYDIRPAQPALSTLFNPRHDLYAIILNTGEVTRLVGEPACGENAVCDGYISPDGSYLARTLPPDVAAASMVVTNLDTKHAVARFEALGVPTGAAYQIGYPFFSPGGQLVYMVAYGAPGLESYHLVLANLVTGEQTLVAEFGPDRHRPLGWTADGGWLLTTREPGLYDTWQINIETGEMRRIAGLMFLGHIEVP